MTIVLNTLEEGCDSEQISALIKGDDAEVINTSGMKIAHCVGCNLCWLKTPGICAIKDDYEVIIKKLVKAENLWLVSDTRFGFVDWCGKRMMDRIVPMLNMYVEFREGLERHELRYHPLNFGLLYKGNADQEFLEEWSQRVASNLAGHSMGVYNIGKESVPCM
jgi:multimeric flavodoxin WrbA